MDGVTLQSKVYYGYAQSALRIGLPFQQFRPTGASNPLGTAIATMPASFNAKDIRYGKANGYASPVWYCVADGRVLQVGDYLQGASGTFFIASMQPLLPIQAVACNRTVTLYRPQQQLGVGTLPYGGNTAANQTATISGFPASILINAKADNGTVKLPSDTRMPWWNLLLPAIPGAVTVEFADIVEDDLGDRYTVSAAELTDMGWRITMAGSQT